MEDSYILVYWNKEFYEHYYKLFDIELFECETKRWVVDDNFYNYKNYLRANIRLSNKIGTSPDIEIDLIGGSIDILGQNFNPANIVMRIPYFLYSVFSDLVVYTEYTLSYSSW